MDSARKSGRPQPRASLSRRLAVLVLVAVATGMVLSAAFLVWRQSVDYAESRREVLLATAQVFAAAVAAPAWNRDQSGSFAAIRAIGRLPDIRYAEVQTADGSTLATLGSVPRLVGDVSLDGGWSMFDLFWSRTIQVSAPIVHGGQPAGRLILIGGTAGLWERLIGTAALTALAGALALAVGLLVAWRFQRGVTGPLRQLMRAMEGIREHHRYDVRVDEAGDREIGLLVDGFNAMLADIRERDSRLEAHRRNLEQEVAERTRDLRDARDVAETANRAKSEFLATMSHEIRTPMNGIMVMAELLASGDMPARQRRYAEVIAHSGQSLLAIINDILDVSKIESGKLELESVRLDVAELAETAVTLFAERARSKNIDLAALVDPAAPRTIVGDPVRLTQIVTNLVNNALKFTERGFVRLTIGPARDGFIAIAVEDTGIGIAPEKIERIFDAFAQADQSTTRQFGGTGLGLAICKKLTSAMGGRIDVASTVGSGSTFAISIPTGDVEYRAWPRLDLGFGGAGYCILNLDGAATVATAARYLAAFGYVVLPADERLASTEYDKASLVCVDADKLPALQLGPRGQRNSIVIAVAHLGDERADRLLADGLADAVVAKPILRSEVEDILACIAAGQPILSAREAASTSATRQFPGLKVLVADDSAVNREVALEALSRLGAATTTVENGREAIAAVEATAFDVVLMDGSMPEIDGFTAAREIRAREVAEGRKRLPIIALTAHVVGTTANAWRDAGMDDVIYKPYTLAQLAGCFARLFPEWAGADAPSISSRVGAPVAAADRIEAQLLDTSMLDDLQAIARGGKQEFLARIFRLYRENAARARDELVSAAQAQDHETCGRLAHALKSMSYNIGAMQVAAHAEAIERQAREDARFPDATQLEALLSSLDATFALIAARSDRASSEEPAARADRSRA